MGEIDIHNLFKLNEHIKKIIKDNKLPYEFEIDTGSYETAIEFIGDSSFHPPISKNWSQNPVIFCPDLLDYENRLIIEYEEEVGDKQLGAKLAKKGHNREGDMDTKRDARRNYYYKHCGFRIVRIWESDDSWKKKLEQFFLKEQSIDIE